MAEKILIADDESDIVSMLDSYFTRRGYLVLKAYSGAEAVRLSERGPDVILLDVSMPDMDGLEVCRYAPTSPAPSSSSPRGWTIPTR